MTPTSADQDPGTSGPARRPAPAGLIWTRPPAEKRERPAREAIVAAATGLAGAHGLDAVSIRRVAAALHTRDQRLFEDSLARREPPRPARRRPRETADLRSQDTAGAPGPVQGVLAWFEDLPGAADEQVRADGPAPLGTVAAGPGPGAGA
jgi:hypothetical protein